MIKCYIFYLLFKVDFTLLLRNLGKFLDYWNALTCKYLIAPQVIAFFYRPVTLQCCTHLCSPKQNNRRTRGPLFLLAFTFFMLRNLVSPPSLHKHKLNYRTNLSVFWPRTTKQIVVRTNLSPCKSHYLLLFSSFW